MPQAKKRVSRSRSTPRSSSARSSRTAVATQTLTSTKLALATLFLGFSAMAAAAAGSLPTAADEARIAERMAKMNGTAASSTPVTATSSAPLSTHAVLKINQGKETYSKMNRIVSPSQYGQTVGVWDATATERPVSLRKISFAIKSYNGPQPISDFGAFKLNISGTKTGYVQAVGVLIPNSNIVRFVLPQPVEIPVFGSTPSSTARIALSAVPSDSGILSPAAIRAFEIAPDTADNIEAMDLVSGGILPPEKILVGTNSSAKLDQPLTAGALLMHDVFPIINKNYLQLSALEISQNARLFKFNIIAQGTRELTVEGVNLNVKVSGLEASAAGIGTIGNFRLYEANASGGIGQLVGKAAPACLAGGKNAPSLAGMPCRFGSEDTIYFKGTVASGTPFTIPANSSRALILVADTTNIFNGKMIGSVSVQASLVGETGLKVGNNGYEKNWADGGLIYSYTPVAGSKVGPFSAADTYSVYSETLTRSL